ncbi:MAG TPA: hypothetical protein VJL84_10335, partial [Kiloniellales bacterium]|nr:hypothetical protein [Kiloniellales bacterium]
GLATAATGALITPGAGGLNALPATAGGNLVILNAQTTYGIGGDDPADVTEITARLDGIVPDLGLPLGNIVLSVPGDLTNATVSLSGNALTASAVVNGAANKVTALSSVGDLPSATVVNQQQAGGTSASASVANVAIVAQLGDTTLGTTVSNASVSMSGNQVGSSAAINDAKNTIGSPGQTFTRTSSF